MTPRELRVHVADPTRALSLAEHRWLADHVGHVGRVLGVGGEVRVCLADDTEMTRVHREYLGIDGTTDVITFDLSEDRANKPQKPTITSLCSHQGRLVYGIDADIWVCVDEARRQASSGGYPFEREVLLYFVHGMLHCLGWDDHDEVEARSMHDVEDAVLSAVGVGPVYRRS